MTYQALKQLRDMLFNPDVDISENGWHIIEIVKQIREQQRGPLIDEITQQMLLRVMKDSPHVYAISVGQFPEFEGVHDFWKENGYHDTDGFIWLVPEPYGPFIEEKFKNPSKK